MTRREAIAALTALPEVARITRATVTPTDVIVVECTGIVSVETAERIKTMFTEIWPNNKIVVCGGDVRIKVVSR
jgi:hypothetical protein